MPTDYIRLSDVARITTVVSGDLISISQKNIVSGYTSKAVAFGDIQASLYLNNFESQMKLYVVSIYQ